MVRTHAFVTGGNGFIGLAVAEALSRHGHTVYALIRKEEHAAQLLQKGIVPVLGDLRKPETYSKYLALSSTVVDTVMTGGSPPSTDNRIVLDAFVRAKQEAGVKGTYRYVYNSGILVYTDTDGKHPTEDDPANNTAIQWRIDYENEVIGLSASAHSQKVDGITFDGAVIRPGFVYGGQGGVSGSWYKFGSDVAADIIVKGNPEKKWGWVHVIDLGDAFRRVVERKEASGQIYNVVDGTEPTYRQVVEGMARANGATGEVKVVPCGDDQYASFIDITSTPSGKKIKEQLGWEPKHQPLLEGIELYQRTWVAHGGESKVQGELEKYADKK